MRRAIVIGSGWGAHAARALSRHPAVELRAVVGRGSARTRALAEELGVETWADAEANIDLAVVAVSERTHFALVAPLLERGVHVLIAHPVCPSAGEVEHLARIAESVGCVARTDYTFRIRPELAALRATPERGELLRVAIEAPGRWLPIALDVAIEIAGPARIIHANGAYPHALTERARNAPHVFVPTVTITHATGTVSTIVPVPHAPPAEPVRVCASYERGRVTASLPRGGVKWMALGARGRVDQEVLVDPSAAPRDASVHARGMQELTVAFVDGLDHPGPPRDGVATLAEEAHLRQAWSAVWRATRRREGADVGDAGAP